MHFRHKLMALVRNQY